MGVVGALLSPRALSHECGAGGRGEKLVGKSCPFPGLLRLMQKVLGKAQVRPMETREKQGVRLGPGGCRGDLGAGQRLAHKEGESRARRWSEREDGLGITTQIIRTVP